MHNFYGALLFDALYPYVIPLLPLYQFLQPCQLPLSLRQHHRESKLTMEPGSHPPCAGSTLWPLHGAPPLLHTHGDSWAPGSVTDPGAVKLNPRSALLGSCRTASPPAAQRWRHLETLSLFTQNPYCSKWAYVGTVVQFLAQLILRTQAKSTVHRPSSIRQGFKALFKSPMVGSLNQHQYLNRRHSNQKHSILIHWVKYSSHSSFPFCVDQWFPDLCSSAPQPFHILHMLHHQTIGFSFK